jgi:hypothetical protein
MKISTIFMSAFLATTVLASAAKARPLDILDVKTLESQASAVTSYQPSSPEAFGQLDAFLETMQKRLDGKDIAAKFVPSLQIILEASQKQLHAILTAIDEAGPQASPEKGLKCGGSGSVTQERIDTLIREMDNIAAQLHVSVAADLGSYKITNDYTPGSCG